MNKMYSENSMAYIMPESRSLDIDTEDDFLFAEFLMTKIKNTMVIFINMIKTGCLSV